MILKEVRVMKSNPKRISVMNGLDASKYVIPEKEMLVAEIIGRHKIISVAAKTNVGKSIWALQLGLAVALGIDNIFGYKIERSSKVLFLNFEMDFDEVMERYQLLLDGLEDYDYGLLENFHINTFEGERELFQDNWDAIEETVKASSPYGLIIVDNLYSCTDKNDERNDELKIILHRIIKVADIHSSSILLVNHHKKHEDEAILTTDLIRGGSTFANAVDVIIQFSASLKEHGLRLMKITKNRSKSPSKLKCFGLKMNDNLWFHNIGEVKEVWHMERPKTPTEDEVILGELPKEFGTRDYIERLTTNTSRSERTGANRLKARIKDGSIQKVSHGRYKKKGRG
jgi:RecA-family ATPase